MTGETAVGSQTRNGLQAKEFELYFEGIWERLKGFQEVDSDQLYLQERSILTVYGKVENEASLPRVSKRVEGFS